MINIQSTLRTAPDLCKYVSLHCYLVATVIHTVCTQSGMCVCVCVCIQIHIYNLQYGDANRVKEIKNWGSSECRLPFWARVPYVLQPWPRVCAVPLLQTCRLLSCAHPTSPTIDTRHLKHPDYGVRVTNGALHELHRAQR